MSKHHNDSMSEQGTAQVIEVETSGQDIRVESGVTNVILISSTSSTLSIGRIVCPTHIGKKLRFMVRNGESFTARFADVANHIVVTGSNRDLAANDSIELQCWPDSGARNANHVWTEIGFTNIS